MGSSARLIYTALALLGALADAHPTQIPFSAVQDSSISRKDFNPLHRLLLLLSSDASDLRLIGI